MMQRDSFTLQQVSYLRARDPSILSFNQPCVLPKAKLETEFEDQAREPSAQLDNHIQVYLRLKQAVNFQDLYEIQTDQNLMCKVPEGSHFLRNHKEGESVQKSYTFSKIFGPDATQTDIFNQVVKPKMYSFINGHNCTLLTYGASGSGKTFTVIGTPEDPGLVPRSLEYLFRTVDNVSSKIVAKPLPHGEISILNIDEQLKERQFCKSFLNASTDRSHVKTYKAMQQRLSNQPAAVCDRNPDIIVEVWVSFAEIYNEQIYDLLQPAPARGKHRPTLRLGSCAKTNHTFIRNLTSVHVCSGLEAYQILQYGLQNLNYAATNLNSHSSRSHSVFTIKLLQISKMDGGAYMSCFNFCDLAGSERSKKTLNVGDRLKESNNINSSLLVLGRCINAVRNCQQQNNNNDATSTSKLVPPFRESKLTQLFQRALSGHEQISMIININPIRLMFDESQHVLNFSAIAKDVTIVNHGPEIVRAKKKKNRFSQYMEHMRPGGATTTTTTVDTQLAINESLEAELDRYRNAILVLEGELEQQRIEYEENARINRERIIEGYKEILSEKDKDTEALIRRAELNVQRQYELKMAQQKTEYERIIGELKNTHNNKSDVIDLDSSDDDEEREKEDKEDSASLIARLKRENEALKRENRMFLEKNKELANTCMDSEIEYNNWERIVKQQREEIVRLQLKCQELETHLATLINERLTFIEETDSDSANTEQEEDKENFSSVSKTNPPSFLDQNQSKDPMQLSSRYSHQAPLPSVTKSNLASVQEDSENGQEDVVGQGFPHSEAGPRHPMREIDNNAADD